MLVFINTPVKDHHRAMLEAVEGYTFRYAQDGEDRLADAGIVIGALDPEQLPLAHNLKWYQLVCAGTDRYPPGNFPAGSRVRYFSFFKMCPSTF